MLEELEPKRVFKYFEDICNIPHASYQEKMISDYVVSFAKQHNLEYYQDDLYNVVIIKEATKGYENEEPVIIQGHMDMVCEKEADCDIDFAKDHIKVYVDGDYVTADKTTLGGDDGIAVAYALAILEDDSIQHPRLEVIFTVSEEVGMEGAASIDLSMLKGKKMLNLDSEDEGIMLASCAGGSSTVCTLPVVRENVTGNIYEITIDGLNGGHSGTEIDKGYANSNVLMGRILLSLKNKFDIRIVDIKGGMKQNAIPRRTDAVIAVCGSCDNISEIINKCADEIKNEYSTTEADMNIAISFVEAKSTLAFDAKSTAVAVTLINSLPNGIQAMSQNIMGLVETSLNLGILTAHTDKVTLEYAVRSSVASSRKYVETKMQNLCNALGANVVVSAEYPAWEYNKDSAFREDVINVYEKMYGKKPVIEAIHAGLECGILAGKIKNLDAVSLGPDMDDIHTTKERLSISSTKRVYEYIIELLKCKK